MYHVVPQDFDCNENLKEVDELREENAWNQHLLEQTFPPDISEHIGQELHFETTDDHWDTPKWMPTASGRFSVTTAWQLVRHRANFNQDYKQLWTKGMPFKISFFLWRLWKEKIPTDDM